MHLRILLVEDDCDQRELIRQTLEDHFGVGTVVEADGRAAALAHDLKAFDVILADYNLPDCNGIELLEDVRRCCATPLIMVTGENVVHIAAEAIRKGATDYVVKLGDYLYAIPLTVEKNLAVAKIKRENESLRSELERAFHALREKNDQLEQSLKKVEEMAATDPLTGLYNRRHFGKVLEQLFAEARRYDTDLACVMIDLDGYKQLNDTFGHQVGDQLLITAGKVIAANLRAMDVAARYGGDEFILLLPRASGAEASNVVTRIRDEFRGTSALGLHRSEGVTMSVGVGSLRGDKPAGAEGLVSAADAALYRAKAAGRNRIVIAAESGVSELSG